MTEPPNAPIPKDILGLFLSFSYFLPFSLYFFHFFLSSLVSESLVSSDILPVAFALVGRCVYSRNSPNGHLSTVATFLGEGGGTVHNRLLELRTGWTFIKLLCPQILQNFLLLKFFFRSVKIHVILNFTTWSIECLVRWLECNTVNHNIYMASIVVGDKNSWQS